MEINWETLQKFREEVLILGSNCTEAVEEMRRYVIRYNDRNCW